MLADYILSIVKSGYTVWQKKAADFNGLELHIQKGSLHHKRIIPFDDILMIRDAADFDSILQTMLENDVEEMEAEFEKIRKNKKEIVIVIYNMYGKHSKMAFEEVLHRLIETYGEWCVKFDRSAAAARRRIKIGRVTILFYDGGIERMSGVRPDYYVSDYYAASEFLRMASLANSGTVLPNFEAMYKVIEKEKGE